MKMKIEGIINMSPHTYTTFSVKKGQQKSSRSDIDVANVLLQLKDKDEQENNEQDNNEKLNSYHKKIFVEQLMQKNNLNDKFKNSPISISSLNNENNENNTIYHKNNNPYRSPTSSVYSSPVIEEIDSEIRNVKEEIPFNNTPFLPPIKYLLETKVVNSSMKDNILPIPDIPTYNNRMNNLSDHLKVNNITLEMSKDDLLYFKSFSNQIDDYNVNRRSSYSSLRDNENYIPNHQNVNMPYNNINITSTNPSPNSDHMYTAQTQPQHSIVTLPPPSIMLADQNNYNNNANQNSYPPYQKPSYYQNNNFNSSVVSSPMNYNNTILSEQENNDRSGSELMNVDNNNMMIQDNGFNSIYINKTIKLCANGPNASNISSKRFGPIPGKKKEKESRRFPKYIIQILEASYNASHYPSNNEKDRLVRDTKLTHRQINDWFINKRARSSCSHQNKRRNMKKLKQQQKAEKSQKI